MVQEVGHAKLRERGIDLIAADSPGSFIDDTPTPKLVRQVLGDVEHIAGIDDFETPRTASLSARESTVRWATVVVRMPAAEPKGA